MSFEDITRSLAARARRWRAGSIFSDQREAEGLRSLLSQHKVTLVDYAWTEASKDAAVTRLRRLMAEGRLCLPEHARLRSELLNLKARLMPSGRTKYETNGRDYASALITLAHAAVDRRVLRGKPRGSYRALRKYRDVVEQCLGLTNPLAASSDGELTWLPPKD